MSTTISSIIRFPQTSIDFLKNHLKERAKDTNSEPSFLFDHALKVVHLSNYISDRYELQENAGDWMACAIFSNNLFSHVVLFEMQRKTEKGSFIYKRSSFLPEMVGKCDFLQAIEKSCRSVKI